MAGVMLLPVNYKKGEYILKIIEAITNIIDELARALNDLIPVPVMELT